MDEQPMIGGHPNCTTPRFTPEEIRAIDERWMQMWVNRARKINEDYAWLAEQVKRLQEHILRPSDAKRD